MSNNLKRSNGAVAGAGGDLMDQITLIKIIGELATLQHSTAVNCRKCRTLCVVPGCVAASVTILIFKQPIETRCIETFCQ